MEGKEDDSNAIHEASEIHFKGLFYEILQYKTLRIICEGHGNSSVHLLLQ